MRTIFTVFILSLLSACGGGGGVACGGLLSSVCSNEKPNTSPVANAGTLQNVTLDEPAFINGVSKLTKLVTLDGSYSTDAETTSLNLTYKWVMTEKPAGSTATLSNANVLRPTFTADSTGIYKISLVVSDGKLNSSEVTVTVVASISNSAPVANAGSKQNIVLGATVMLDGTGSTDADLNDPRIYKWTLQVPLGSSSTASLSDATSPRPTFIADKLGDYIATLIVSDGKQESSPSQVIIVSTNENTAPTANAGIDQNITLKSNPVTVTLDGTNSSDAENDKLSYKWTWMSYPSSLSAAPTLDSLSPRPTFTPTVAGSYVLTLTVYDQKKYSDPDPVTITVNSINSAPVANAGIDQYVTLSSTNKVTLSGASSSDPDYDTLTYQWSLSKPSADTSATLVNSSTVSPYFYASTEGVYVASLIVTDSKGNVSSVSQTRITASAANSPPVANAGTKQTVTSATLVTLNGTNSTDADGDALTYSWSIQSQPDSSSSTLSLTNPKTASPTFTPDAVGIYVIKLIVNDGKVDSAPHTVTITRSS